jgi:2-methylisocitrate lyase-like PEP mutase family enzyme
MTRSENVALFRKLHDQRPLVLPNAWDAASARTMERAGAGALGTTSAGVCWARGRGDGQTLTRDQMVREVRAIVNAVAIPVSADVESGYGAGTAADVAETVRAVLEAGAVGINLEDAPGSDGAPLLTLEAQTARLQAARAAARAAGADLVINARTDVYLAQVGAAESRLDEAVRRGRAYLAAGADCVFVPGVVDRDTIALIVEGIDGRVNIMTGPGAPSVEELGRLGVARASVGPAITLAALAATWRATVELLGPGTYGELGRGLPFGDVDASFKAPAAHEHEPDATPAR